jgi:hypothetical protein
MDINSRLSIIKKKIKATRDHWPAFMLFALVALLPITWIQGNEILIYGDGNFPGPVDFNTYRFAWAERFYGANPGRYIFSGFVFTPIYSFIATLQSIGFTPGIVQKFLLCSSLFLSGFLTYLTAIFLLKIGRLASVFTGLVYTLNIHALMYAWMPQIPLYFFWAFMPVTLALCVKVIQSRDWLYFSLLQVILLIHTLGFANPTYIIMVWGAMFSISLYLVLSGQQRLKHVLVRFTFIGFVWCLLNAYWILPNLYGLENALFTRYNVYEKSVDSFVMIQYATRFTSILNSLRMLGSNLLYYPQASWISIYHSQPILVFTGFLLPAIGIYGIIENRRSKMMLYFSLMWVLFLFLAKGIHPPLGQLMQWGFDRIPGFLIFRNSSEKLGYWAVMSLCFIAGYGVNAICGRLRLRLHRTLFVTVLAVLLAGLYAWPAWTGAIVGKNGSTSSSPIAYAVEIPESYSKAAQTIAQDKSNFFVLVLPRGDGGPFPNWYTHLWRYQGVEIFSHLIDTPSLAPIYLTPDAGEPVNVAGYIYNAILSSSPSLDAYLAMLNIGYIVVHNDLNPVFHNTESSNKLNEILSDYPNLKLIEDFGELTVYRVENVLPVIYSTKDIVSVLGDIGSLSSLVALDTYNERQSYLFDSTQQLSYGIEEGAPNVGDWFNESTGLIIAPNLIKNSSQTSHSVLEINVPISGNYELLASDRNPSLVELKIDNTVVPIGSQSININGASVWKSWGNINLTKGKHIIEILAKESANTASLLLRKTESQSTIPPRIEFIKQNPTRYLIHIQKTNNPFLLVFSQTYHPDWVITDACETEKGEVKAQHILVNGYANGWWIEDFGECDLVIEFWPQKLLTIGAGISILTILLLVIVNLVNPKIGTKIAFRDDG